MNFPQTPDSYVVVHEIECIRRYNKSSAAWTDELKRSMHALADQPLTLES